MEELIQKIYQFKDGKTLKERALKLTEEAGEVAGAVLSYTQAPGCGYKNKTKEDVIEECVDTIIVALNILSAVNDYNVDEELIKEIINKKLDKWEKVTLERK
jgi:NTP pyrophosphatase (non-canonical NTP hydrolase)